MALQRIRFNTVASDSGAFTVRYNPRSLELNENDSPVVKYPLDGGGISQSRYFDNRPVYLKWFRMPASLSGFLSMLGTLNSYKGSNKYVHFGDIDYRLTGTGWSLYYVNDVQVTIEPGGRLRYNVTVELLPEE